MSDHPIHNTDGVTASMVDSIGDDVQVGRQPEQPQAFAAPSSGDPYAVPPDIHNHAKSEPCESCKKELGVMRAALIILAIIIGALAMVYLAQRRGHAHGDGNKNASAPIADD